MKVVWTVKLNEWLVNSITVVIMSDYAINVIEHPKQGKQHKVGKK